MALSAGSNRSQSVKSFRRNIVFYAISIRWIKERRLQGLPVMNLRNRKGDPMKEATSVENLISDIVEINHNDIRSGFQELEPLVSRVCRVHRDRHPELEEIQKIFLELKRLLSEHLAEEDGVWFPHMRRLANHGPVNSRYACCGPYHEHSPDQQIHSEHAAIRLLLEKMRVETDEYTAPSDACTTYELTFAKLRAFDGMLIEQMRLEEEVLIPKVKFLEDARLEARISPSSTSSEKEIL